MFVMHLVEGLNLGTLMNLLSGYTENNNIHIRTTVTFILEKLIRKNNIKILSSGLIIIIITTTIIINNNNNNNNNNPKK
jgi:hypothetical protein